MVLHDFEAPTSPTQPQYMLRTLMATLAAHNVWQACHRIGCNIGPSRRPWPLLCGNSNSLLRCLPQRSGRILLWDWTNGIRMLANICAELGATFCLGGSESYSPRTLFSQIVGGIWIQNPCFYFRRMTSLAQCSCLGSHLQNETQLMTQEFPGQI